MKKIYIIDDDRNIVEAMSIVLKAHGYDVACQYNEENVIENLVVRKPDLVILDVIFPQNANAGFDIARQIKNNQATASIPIIMLSAINEKGVYAGTFSNNDRDDTWLPIDQFVEKPIRNDQLLQKIRTVLEKKNTGQ
ncbi:MAG: response regulator [Verrucomicrobia bacterium]|nr:response regulator [Verrucomicrobiota bacterium]MBU4292054.1 response regulator [Verrucomicrobiota bacterium]MBU4428147.1 response regulator [Verrucomicrobiota bacterium]MCG2678888.1 response regulator [Kiritimatiellia bacterium]